MTKPFLKWVGGKSRLVQELMAQLPLRSGIHHEPFLGSGAFFFARGYVTASLSDLNRPLIDTFLAVRDHTDELCEALDYMQAHHGAELYRKTRAAFNRGLPPIPTAAAFIYLNRTCFNGVYRLNRAGAFNVPMGSYKNPILYDRETLLECARKLKHASVFCGPYTEVLRLAAPGDFVYFDPPYHETFTGYTAHGFDAPEQEQLAELCATLHARGVLWLLSNSDTPLVRSLYARFTIQELEVRRSVGQKPSSRVAAKEVLVRNY